MQGVAETGDHLVEDEHRAVLGAQAAETLEEALHGRLGASRFEENRGDAVRSGGEHRLDAVEVVVAKRGVRTASSSLMPPAIVVVAMNQSS